MKKTRFIGVAILVYLLNIYSIPAQDNWGVGLRIGDPLGISVKKYMGDKALEFNVGRSHTFYRHGWYNKRFDVWYKNKNFGYKEFQYLNYHASTPVSIQAHYLFHKDIKSVNNLQWYWGVGAQFRIQNYYFDYRFKIQGDPNWYYAVGEKVTDLDIGVDGVLGLEYTFKDIPLSVFGDVMLFMEFADNPFAFWLQGGVGVRYNF
jgi:hypothetical protein